MSAPLSSARPRGAASPDVAASPKTASPRMALESRHVSLPLATLCFVLSGFAALLYETVWLRQFSTVFGTSDLAVSAILASYMGGLALGAALAGRWVDRIGRPLRAYALLELGIAGGALAVKPLMQAAHYAHVAWWGGLAEPPAAVGNLPLAFQFATSFAILMLPTMLMGATLPLLIRGVVRRDEEVGSRAGLLYAANTAGAVAGTLTAAFALLPTFGLQRTVWIGVAVNLAVATVAALSDRRSPIVRIDQSLHPTVISIGKPSHAPEPSLRLRSAVLPLILLSGAVSFTYEVLWTRLLSHLVGGSLYAFATMLAAFLAGLTLGSSLASRWARNARQAAGGFVVAQVGAAGTSLLLYQALGRLPALAERLGTGEHATTNGNAVLAVLVLLPASLCIGATFPFAVRILTFQDDRPGHAAARVSCWNTIGAITGALAAGLWILPQLGFAGTATLAIALNVVLALAACLLFVPASPRHWAAVGVAGLFVLLVPPQRPDAVLRSSPFRDMHATGDIVFSAVGRSATVMLVEQNGMFALRSNGLPEGGIAARGASPGSWFVHRWLPALPVLARPRADSMLIVGLGGGVAAAAVPGTVGHIDVIELEPEVLAANRMIADARHDDPLSDPRVHVILNDARSALALTSKRYDAIVSQPSHPWISGAAHLYTREFAQLVHEHLEPRGVFLQWMDSTCIDEDLFKTVAATLLDVYKHVRLYRVYESTLLFLASDAPLEIERQLARTGAPLNTSPAEFHWLGINDVNDVAALLAMEDADLREFCAGVRPNTDDENRLAARSSQSLRRAEAFDIDVLLKPFDPLTRPDSRLATTPEVQLDPVAVVRRRAVMRMWTPAVAAAEAIPEPSDRWLALSLVYGMHDEPVAAEQALARSLESDPHNQQALFKQVEPAFTLLAQGRAPAEIVTAAARLDGPEQAVTSAWHALKQHDMQTLAALDARLAAARPGQLCYPVAANLRAYWRTQLPRITAAGGPAVETHYAEEALLIVDRGLAVQSSLLGYLVRLNAARAAGRPDVLVETANFTARFFEESQVPRDVIETSSRDVLKNLVDLRNDPRVPAGRVEQVEARFEALLSSP